MSNLSLNQDQIDTLQELVNIAMGQAGDSLARILDTFVELSVPRIRVVTVDELTPTVINMVDSQQLITAVRQAFYNSHKLHGEAVMLYGEKGCNELADLMGYEGELDHTAEQELLLDVSNVLVGACLNGLAEQLATDLSFSAPSIMAQQSPVQMVMTPENLSWSHALLVEVNFGLENRDFKSHLLMLMAEEAIIALGAALDKFLESL